MKLRLYALRDTRTNKIIPDVYFFNKKDAKHERDLRKAHGEQLVVTSGPDHHKYKP